jgi:ligand-binding sensor domain-containing protein
MVTVSEVASFFVIGVSTWSGFATADGLTQYNAATSEWQAFTAQDGLPEQEVLTVRGSSESDIWVGTAQGLAVYDEVAWQTLHEPVELDERRVEPIWVDESGDLWAASGTDVMHYDGQNWRAIHQPGDTRYGIQAIWRDESSSLLWLGTYHGALSYDGSTWQTFTSTVGLIDNSVQAIWGDGTGVVWFGTHSGISRYDGQEWTSFTTDDGLSGNHVQAIWGDQEGNIWVGTTFGLSRYDGEGWHTFGASDGLADNDVRAIWGDSSGVVWFGTDRGASRYDGEKWQTFASPDVLSIFPSGPNDLWLSTYYGIKHYDGAKWRDITTSDGLSGNWVRAVLQDRQGGLWAAIQGEGIDYFDGETWHRIPAIEPDIRAIETDSTGRVWVGTSHGVAVFNGRDWQRLTPEDDLREGRVTDIWCGEAENVWVATRNGVSHYNGVAWRDFDAQDGLAGDWVNGIWGDSSGVMWFATSMGVSSFDGKQWRDFTVADGLPDNYISAIWGDGGGNYWIGTSNGRIARYDGKSWYPYEDQPPSASAVKAIWADSPSNLWAATRGNGVFHYDGESWAVFDEEEGLSSDYVLDIVGNEQGILCATTDGLSRFNGRVWDTFDVGERLSANGVLAIAGDSDTGIWIGSGSAAIGHFSGGEWKEYPVQGWLISDEINAIYETPDGHIWCATSMGVSCYNGRSWENYTKANNIGSDEVNCIWQHEDTIWLGTTGGASYYGEGSWHTFTVEDGLADNGVLTVFVDSEQRVWFGTASGATCYDGAEWRTHTLQDGLAGNEVRSILEDKSRTFWFGTSNGVSRFDGRNWQRFYNGNSGLLDDDIHTIVQDPEGRVLIGTGTWYGAYTPGIAPPQPYIDGLCSVLEESPSVYSDTLDISLPHDQNAIRIMFSANDLTTRPKEMVYRYSLHGPQVRSGFVPPPSASEKRGTVEFHGLSPGHYVFALEAGNANLDYSTPVSSSFAIRSAPPTAVLSWVKTARWTDASTEEVVAKPRLWEASQFVTFGFSGYDDVTDRLSYSYTLEGPSEGDRVGPVVTTASRVFHDLSPGTHKLTIQAIDEEDQKSSPVISSIVIPPPGWRTVLPYIIVTVLSFLTSFLVYRRVRQVQARRTRFNPYRDGPPVTEARDFFGRQRELDNILSTIASNHVLIIGRRRVGKTSLLHQAARRLKQFSQTKGNISFWPVYFTLQGAPSNRFYAELMRAIDRQTCCPAQDLAYDDEEKYDDVVFEDDLRCVLEDLVMRSAPDPTRLVLCLDELDALETYPPAVRERLRALIQEMEPNVRLLAAGVSAAEQTASLTSPFYNQFARIRLSALSRHEAERLIRDPVAGTYAYTSEAVDYILSRTHGFPQPIQKLCHHAVFAMLDEGSRHICLREAQLAFDRAVDDYAPEFQLIWHGGQDRNTNLTVPPLAEDQRQVLRQSLVTGEPVERKSYEGAAAVFRRAQLDVLTYEEEGVLWLTDFFAAWLERSIA